MTKRTGIVGLLSIGMGMSVAAQAAPHGMFLTQQQSELFRIINVNSDRFESDSSKKPKDSPKVLYYGGPVLGKVKVYAVMWGKQVDATTQAQIGDFYTAAVDSSYLDWLSEYNTNVKAVDGRDGSGQTIGRGSFAGTIVITPTNTSAKLDDTDIQAELDQQITAGNLPAPDSNTLFMTYFPPGVSITIQGQASCEAFCGYHEGFASKTHGNVFYGVMPDLGGMCAFGCGMADNMFDNLTVVSSHELTEAITDPFPTPATSPAFPQAWNTSTGDEIGDLCVSNSAKLTTKGLTYAVQAEYDNSVLACTSRDFQSP